MSYHGSVHGASPYGELSPINEVSALVASPASGIGSVPHVSSTESHLQVTTTGSDLQHTLSLIQFEKQPPDNMRKSNFFHFIISLFDCNQQRVEVHRAVFKGFCDTTANGQEYRNGLIYKITVVYGDGVQKEEELHVRLIDSNTKQLIPYEGTCKNPDFRRVLLTHELICSRCLEHRSCGNKNDTPSDPILIDRYRLKFFVKCNQNCLKNAGNPKDSRRRFQVAMYAFPNTNDSPIGCSDAMFVHNNSKHGRKANPVYPGRDAIMGDGKPYIISVHPHEGWTTGGTSVCIVGMNFYEGTEVVFGTLAATSEYISPCAIAVKTPQSPRPGEVDITLVCQGSQYCINNPGKFLYLAPDESHFEHNFTRLERLLRNHDEPEDIPKDILLKRAADALETFYSLPRPPHNYSQSGATGPLSHIYYPGSPALFTVTPQMPQHLLSPNRKVHTLASMEGGESSNTNGVSRCSSGEQPVGVEAGGPGFFDFPQPGHAGVKVEHMPIHKPKPITPGVYPAAVAMPFLQVTQMHTHGGYSGYAPNSSVHSDMNGFMTATMNEDESNRNNNNSNTLQPGFGQPMVANWAGNPIHFIPPSPGLFMAPTASPGPLPITPNGPGGSSMFNFCSQPMISPAKPLRSVLAGNKGGKPGPLNMPNADGMIMHGIGALNYQQTAMLAALPSPGIPGTFVFPPATPTSLIAPISLPDLSTSDTVTSSHPSFASADTPQQSAVDPQQSADTPHSTSDSEPPAPKKRKGTPP